MRAAYFRTKCKDNYNFTINLNKRVNRNAD